MRRALALALAFLAAASRPIRADEPARDYNILFISSFETGSSKTGRIVDGLRAAFAEAGAGISVFIVTLDEIRFPADEAVNELALRLAERRYSKVPFDIVLAQGTAAFDLAVRRRKALDSSLPIIVFDVMTEGIETRHPGEKEVYGRILTNPSPPTIALARRLFPGAKRLVAAGARGGTGLTALFALLEAEGRENPSLDIDMIMNADFEDLDVALSSGPESICLFYTSDWVSSEGRPVSAKAVISRLWEKRPTPMFSVLDELFGTGLVGGYFIDDARLGREAAGVALDLLLGRARPVPWSESAALRPELDYRSLERLSIAPAAAPRDAEIAFRPPSFWIRYQYWLEALGGLLAAATCLMAVRLALKRRDRMALERANAELEARVELRTDELRSANVELESANANLTASIRRIEGMQDRLVADAKDVVLGRLALALANEINSPLGAIGASNATMMELVSGGGGGIAPSMLAMERPQLELFLSLAAEKSRDSIRIVPPTRDLRASLASRLERLGVGDPGATADLALDAGADGFGDDELVRLCSPENRCVLRGLFLIATLARSVAVSEAGVRKIAETMEAIRGYARDSGSAAAEATADVAASIEDALRLIDSAGGGGAAIRREVDPSIGRAVGERASLARLWANLLQNATDAAGAKGDITVRAFADGRRAVVEVSDSGPGVPEELRARLFEPLTKALGEGFAGLGLGLSICKRIVDRSGGSIEYDGSGGRTVFRVRLPLAEDRAGTQAG